jgi:cytochrome c biogenesis protein CcdA
LGRCPAIASAIADFGPSGTSDRINPVLPAVRPGHDNEPKISNDECMIHDVSIPAALIAGLVSFLSPCVLPLVPPYLVYLTGATIEHVAND